MTQNRWNIIGIFSLILVAAGTYFLANAQLEGLYNYRSLLWETPPEPGEAFAWAQEEPLTERVVFILVDGLRNDTSHNAEIMPHLNELREQSAWATSHSQEPSYSAPGYSTLGVGAWPHLNDGPVFNLAYEDIPTWTQDNLFSAVHRAGLKTALSGYYWFEKLIPQNDVDASFYTPDYDAAADVAVVNAALSWIESGEYQLVFIHIDQLDTAGHEFGVDSPEWDAAAAQADAHIREIVSLLDLGQDTVLITSDHGQINTGGHGGSEEVVLTEPLVLLGAGINPSQYPDTQMVDIAPTLAVLLGANIPATSQGHILFEMLALSAEQKNVVEAAIIEQKKELYAYYAEVIGDPLPIREDLGFVDGANFAIDAMLLQQVDKLRRLRFNQPLGVMVILTYLIFRSWKKLKIFTYGAIAYVLLFNIYYALIAGRVYSFSTINDENEWIIFNIIATVVIMVGVWLVMMRQKTFKENATPSTLSLIMMILYLWFLPVLWNYGVNGFAPSWYLPDFSALFTAILALTQITFVAIAGIILSGVAALITKINTK